MYALSSAITWGHAVSAWNQMNLFGEATFWLAFALGALLLALSFARQFNGAARIGFAVAAAAIAGGCIALQLGGQLGLFVSGGLIVVAIARVFLVAVAANHV